MVIAAYGGKCICCEEPRPAFLNIDHVHNDGKLDREEKGTSHGLYLWLIRNNFPKENYQLLCRNCNFAKWALGECPHETERRISANEQKGIG